MTDRKLNPVNQRTIGSRKEALAEKYLCSFGMRILEKNFRCRQGEIDLIGEQDGCLVFVEVKYRSSASHGLPEEAVGIAKQRRICRVADYYRALHQVSLLQDIRYDVVAIEGEAIRWYPSAFTHISR